MGTVVNVMSGCWMAAFYAMEYVWTTLGWNLKVQPKPGKLNPIPLLFNPNPKP